MTTLLFALAILAIFVSVLVVEHPAASAGGTTGQIGSNTSWGLLRWLSHGNWPAKLGAALLIVGCGALLRYALIHIELPPYLKLGGGFVLAAALGLAALLTGREGRRRSIGLALAGAAFGVAYLTAYSAYALFDYVTQPTALGLLGVTSIAAAAYAVSRKAISVAILGMLGAYLAPAFALGSPGPTIVLGYYTAASALVFGMVLLRQWRALIHLSFLFTLAGGVFFGWTAEFYRPEYFNAVYPWLLALIALHLAMPMADERPNATGWLHRLDIAYLVILPLVAVALTITVAPSRNALAALITGFATLWAVAAVARRVLARSGALAHAVIAVALYATAVGVAVESLRWQLLGLTLAVAGLAIAERRAELAPFRGALAGAAALFGALQIVESVFVGSSGGSPLLNWAFAERLATALLLVGAGILCRRARHDMAGTLTLAGSVWSALALAIELARFEWLDVPLLLHAAVVATAFAMAALPRLWERVRDGVTMALAIAIPITAWLAANDSTTPVAWMATLIAPLAAIALAARSNATDNLARELALFAAPLSALAWGYAAAATAAPQDVPRVALIVALMVAVGAHAVTFRARTSDGASRSRAFESAIALTAMLSIAVMTTIYIARSPWAVALELVALGALAYVGYTGARAILPSITWGLPAGVVALALIAQANLLRAFGPPGPLDLVSVLDMGWPALVTLTWAAVGAALTIWATRVRSRAAWVSGAVILVAAAAKVVLVDFGSLGELANILAVIAAGGVFLLVGWLAPMPPARPAPPAREPAAPIERGQTASANPTPTPPETAASAKPPQPISAPTMEMALPDSYAYVAERKRAETAQLQARTESARAWGITALVLLAAALVQCVPKSTLFSSQSAVPSPRHSAPQDFAAIRNAHPKS